MKMTSAVRLLKVWMMVMMVEMSWPEIVIVAEGWWCGC